MLGILGDPCEGGRVSEDGAEGVAYGVVKCGFGEATGEEMVPVGIEVAVAVGTRHSIRGREDGEAELALKEELIGSWV